MRRCVDTLGRALCSVRGEVSVSMQLGDYDRRVYLPSSLADGVDQCSADQ